MTAAIDLIREKLNIADIVSGYVKDLHQAGRNYKACCPFHSEKTPSFVVSPDKGMFYCFGCHEGGDIFKFVMKMEGITFHEAAKKLAARAGVEYGRNNIEFSREEKERYAIRKALSFAAKFYADMLFSKDGEKARLYIGGRKVNKAISEQFGLGWAPPQGQELLGAMRRAGIGIDIAEKAGLVKRNSNGGLRDVFRGRLVFPIRNIAGDVIAFGGRTLDPEFMPKYLNSPDTVLFHKKRTLYGIDRAMPEIRRAGRVLVLEGYMDVIGAHQHGISYAVAPLGTALTTEHAEILGRAAQDIILMFDGDSAGIKASVRAAEIFMEAGMFVKIASLPDGLDPDEYLNKYGTPAFERLIAGAEDPLEFRIRMFFKNFPSPSAQDKAKAINVLLKTVEKQHDEIVKSEWIRNIAGKFNVDEKSVLRQFEKISRTAKDGKRQPYSEERQKNSSTNGEGGKIPPLERDILQMLIRTPQLVPHTENIDGNDFSSALARQIFIEIRTMPEEDLKNMAIHLAEKFPQAEDMLYKMAMYDNDMIRQDHSALAAAARLLRTSSLKRKMAELKKAKTMTAEQLQEYSMLAMELKASGGVL